MKYKRILLGCLALVALMAVLLPVRAYDAAPQSTSQRQVEVWWPLAGGRISGVQTFKAQVPGLDVNSYNMFWQVDHGQWNWMYADYTDWPHKQAVVDLSGWNWHGSGPYSVNFIAVDTKGSLLAQKEVQLGSVGTASATLTSPPVPLEAKREPATSVALTSSALYAPSSSTLRTTANSLITNNAELDSKLTSVANQPIATWFGNWNQDVARDVRQLVEEATRVNKVPVLVAYNIPKRDCGGYSAGGAQDYRSWIASFANGLGSSHAIVILEPDALAGLACLSSEGQANRLDLLRFAVDTLSSHSHVQTYIDAGHPGWIAESTMADRLRQVHVDRTSGFALNTSNFVSTDTNISYGRVLSNLLGGTHFVVDTSRNGKGAPANTEWCNPDGRAVGQAPSLATGVDKVDAYLWVKNPAESDGPCHGGPPAGQTWSSYLFSLVKNS